ncbi:MAG: Mov34/MPN/PAD-1 family protein [Deltaproteobacteria bacterium]|nr:Mov34/MPN/PAD-1 family protein [Deltaproteobacteria bacterium]
MKSNSIRSRDTRARAAASSSARQTSLRFSLDPVTFPRTSNTYFKINELRAARTFEQGQNEGRPVKVIYHSHCDAGAYFSDEDAATFANEGQLMWPCAYIVVSVVKGELAERRLWVHEPGTNGFRESTLTIREP